MSKILKPIYFGNLESSRHWMENRLNHIIQEWQRFVTLVKQSQKLKNVSYHKLYDILKQHQHDVNEIRAEKIARVANPLTLVTQQQQVNHPQTHPTQYNQYSSTRTHQAATRNRGKAIVNSPQPIYDQEPSMVDDDEDTSKDKEIDKLMALISLSRQRSGTVAGARQTVGSSMVPKSRIQCYNCKEYGHVARECQKPKRAKDAAYHREKMLLCMQEEAEIQLNAEQADWKDDTDDESDDQELEAHYMYMGKIQEVSSDAVDSGPIFDTEPEQKVQNDDHYDVFAIECQHTEQSKSVHNTYHIEQDAQNVSIESVDMNYDIKQIDQNDEDVDLAKRTLIEANNKLSKENDLLFTDFMKPKAELKRRDSIEYATEMELECAKWGGGAWQQGNGAVMVGMMVTWWCSWWGRWCWPVWMPAGDVGGTGGCGDSGGAWRGGSGRSGD
nr:hypothetical protein [Tanacetum cinerariifolium]